MNETKITQCGYWDGKKETCTADKCKYAEDDSCWCPLKNIGRGFDVAVMEKGEFTFSYHQEYCEKCGEYVTHTRNENNNWKCNKCGTVNKLEE